MANIVMEKSFAFAVRIVNLCRHLSEKREWVLSKQLLRSGTAIGAPDSRSGTGRKSKSDFIHKLAIALKEANETEYWLLLLQSTDYLDATEFASLHRDNLELLKLLTSIIKSSRQRPKT